MINIYLYRQASSFTKLLLTLYTEIEMEEHMSTLHWVRFVLKIVNKYSQRYYAMYCYIFILQM